MSGGGSKPGERRGGRKIGTPNKRTQALQKAQQAAKAEMEKVSPPPSPSTLSFDPLDQLERIAITFIGMAAKEQQKDKPDQKWLASLLECAARTCKEIAPYRHRRYAALGIDVEALMQRDGSLKVTISSSDAGL